MALENSIWEGPEAEGTYKGIRTLFIRNASVQAEWVLKSPYPHVFFTKELKDLYIVEKVLLAETKLVTVEVWDKDIADLPWIVKTKAHILVRIHADWLDQLKETDNIIIGNEYRGSCFVKGMAITSSPTDYRNDRKVSKEWE